MRNTYSDPLARQLLSVSSFLDPRFIADYVPTDVGMSKVNSWMVEEGAAYVTSKNEQAQPQGTLKSTETTHSQAEVVKKRK